VAVSDKSAKAQAIFWECEKLRNDLAKKLREMARLHADLAYEMIGRGNPDGFIDLHAAIAAYGEAQDFAEAERLIAEGDRQAKTFSGRAYKHLQSELDRAAIWIRTLKSAAGDAVTTKARILARGDGNK